jgi:hypothetical protein
MRTGGHRWRFGARNIGAFLVTARDRFRFTMARCALPLLAFAATIAPPPVQAGDLPLRRGAYVEASTHCGDAASSDRTWFGGGYVLQAAHAQCSLVSVRQHGKADYVVVERCFANADRSMPFTLVNHVHILSHREYRLVNREGRFRSRWCRD